MSQEQDRAEYVQGLRELAAFIETHPDAPLPYAGAQNAFASKADMIALARSGGRWNKRFVGDYFCLTVEFAGGHSYEVSISRDQVCRKVVTGTRVEPAQPERVIEEFKWVCDGSLLSATETVEV